MAFAGNSTESNAGSLYLMARFNRNDPASLFHQLLQHHVNMLLPEYVLFDRRYTAKNYWLSKIYTQNIIVHLLQVVPEVTLCAWTHTVFIIVCLVTNIWNCSPATT